MHLMNISGMFLKTISVFCFFFPNSILTKKLHICRLRLRYTMGQLDDSLKSGTEGRHAAERRVHPLGLKQLVAMLHFVVVCCLVYYFRITGDSVITA